MTTVKDIYTQLAVRINYPIQPTYRCLSKIIGYINLLLSLTNTPQVVVEVKLQGPPRKRFYKKQGEKIAYLKHGQPCKLNPDGTIDTPEESGFVIRNGLFISLENGATKDFVTSETDILADDYYLQPLLTSLYLIISGVQPTEAVQYLNDACTRTDVKVETRQVNLSTIKRKL